MIWKQSRQLCLVLLSFLMVIFLSGTALAQRSENNNDLVRFGGDLTVLQKQVVCSFLIYSQLLLQRSIKLHSRVVHVDWVARSL